MNKGSFSRTGQAGACALSFHRGGVQSLSPRGSWLRVARASVPLGCLRLAAWTRSSAFPRGPSAPFRRPDCAQPGPPWRPGGSAAARGCAENKNHVEAGQFWRKPLNKGRIARPSSGRTRLDYRRMAQAGQSLRNKSVGRLPASEAASLHAHVRREK